MGLRALIQSLDDVDEQYRNLYVRTDDGYVLDIDDGGFKSRISEFRNNNIDLRRQLDATKDQEQELERLRDQVSRFKDIDPEKATEALQKMAQLKDKELLDSGKIDELVAQRVERQVENMRKDYDGKVAALEGAVQELTTGRDNFRKLYSDNVTDSTLLQAIGEIGTLRKGAAQDALGRGHKVWQVNDDGNLMPVGPDGKVLYGRDGKSPVTPKEWAEGLMTEASYLFEGSAGGGSRSGTGNGAGDGKKVSFGDQEGINRNIADIASGKVEVVHQ